MPSPHNSFPSEIVIPEVVRTAPWADHLVERTRHLAWSDVVIPLQRTGSLAFNLVRGCADELGIILPPVVELLVGREISGAFEDRRGVQLDDYAWSVHQNTPLPLHVAGDESVEAYYAWLTGAARRKTSPVWRAIQRLREAAGGLCPLGEAMIVDETVYQGVTLYVTAPFVVQHALPGVRIRALELCDANLLRDIVIAHFPEVKPYGAQSDAERLLLRTLIKGAIDDRGRLEMLDERSTARLGARIARQCTYAGAPRPKNPFRTLAARYGLANLISLHEMTVRALYAYGRSLGERSR
jgi:hypothetical protein